MLLLLLTFPCFLLAKLSICLHCGRNPRPRSCLRRLIVQMTSFQWRLALWLVCWIRIQRQGFKEAARAVSGSSRPAVIIANHLSMMDAIMLLSAAPPSLAPRVKVFASGRLLKIPIVGTLVRSMGHLFVPFTTSSAEAGMQVDKDKMQVVQQALEDHVRAGGVAAWFPEGALNKGDPAEPAQFRAGGFVLPARVDVEIWGIAFLGTGDCWPPTENFGGRPSRVWASCFKIHSSSHDVLSGEMGGPGLEDERAASLYLAEFCHAQIRSEVRQLRAEKGPAKE